MPLRDLRRAELAHQLVFVIARHARPGLAVEDARVFAHDGVDGAMAEDGAGDAGHFAELAGDTAKDLLGGLGPVEVGEGVVFVGIDDDEVEGGGRGVAGASPLEGCGEIPAI